MRLSYQTITWGGIVGHPAGVTSVAEAAYLAHGSTEEAVREIAQAGYSGIELFDGNLLQYASNVRAFRKLLADAGIRLVAVYCGANFIYPDILDDELARIERVARLSEELGAEHLVVGGGAKRAAGTREEDYSLLAEGLDKVASLAKRYRLVASYHPHLGTIVETPQQIQKVFSLTEIPFCPDTAHIAAGGGDPVGVIRRYISRIPYVHLKDYASGKFLPPGKGTIDIAGVVSVLKENGYDGWVTVELDYYDGPAKEAAEIGKRYLEPLLRT